MIRQNLVATMLGLAVFAYTAVVQPSVASTFKAQTVASPKGAEIFVRSGGQDQWSSFSMATPKPGLFAVFIDERGRGVRFL